MIVTATQSSHRLVVPPSQLHHLPPANLSCATFLTRKPFASFVRSTHRRHGRRCNRSIDSWCSVQPSADVSAILRPSLPFPVAGQSIIVSPIRPTTTSCDSVSSSTLSRITPGRMTRFRTIARHSFPNCTMGGSSFGRQKASTSFR
jgi:hypothetical protein